MSVLIKGMEMPKNCAVCRLEKDLFGRAVCFGYEDGRALHKDDLPPVGNEERRPSWCPLIPVPQHGRLIDADALEELFREVIGNIAKRKEMEPVLEHMVRASAMVIEMIDDAPTIIEAEEGE